MDCQDGGIPELNNTAASILGFLLGGPQSGWDLAGSIELQLGDFWHVTRSQIYRELKALAAAGLVEPGEVTAREKRAYTITGPGREAFATWLHRMPGEDIIRVPLLLTLFFADHLEREDLAAMVAGHRARHEENLATYQALAPAFRESDPHIAVVVDYGIAHETAVLAWMDGLPWS